MFLYSFPVKVMPMKSLSQTKHDMWQQSEENQSYPKSKTKSLTELVRYVKWKMSNFLEYLFHEYTNQFASIQLVMSRR